MIFQNPLFTVATTTTLDTLYILCPELLSRSAALIVVQPAASAEYSSVYGAVSAGGAVEVQKPRSETLTAKLGGLVCQ